MTRRPQGTGSVYPNKGRWIASIRTPTGRKEMMFATRELAEAALPAITAHAVVGARSSQLGAEDMMRARLDRVIERKSSRLPVAGHFVYILWGDDPRRPLYVGESGHLLQRLGWHYRNHGQDIRSVQLLECATREDRLALEQDMIWKYRPIHNRTWAGQAVAWDMPRSARRPPNQKAGLPMDAGTSTEARNAA